jgi:hypothetical protein
LARETGNSLRMVRVIHPPAGAGRVVRPLPVSGRRLSSTRTRSIRPKRQLPSKQQKRNTSRGPGGRSASGRVKSQKSLRLSPSPPMPGLHYPGPRHRTGGGSINRARSEQVSSDEPELSTPSTNAAGSPRQPVESNRFIYPRNPPRKQQSERVGEVEEGHPAPCWTISSGW